MNDKADNTVAITRTDIVFPCPQVPDRADLARLVGLYPQRQEGLWMQRAKVPGGVLTGRQWRGLARIARDVTPGTPLHLTTRQDVELHDLPADRVPDVQRRLAEIDLTSVGACGDTLRNITVCPCSGVQAGAVDLFPAARQVRRTLEAEQGVFSLPRKFKISFSCSRACGQPWINDLGFVARRRAGQYGFHLVGAGSLGVRPAAGVVLYEWLSPADVLPAAVAAVRVFAAEGDRAHRARARLRHVRQRVGDRAFAALLREALDAVRAERRWPAVDLPKGEDGFTARLTLTFARGDVWPEAADALAALADHEDVRVRIGNHHRVVVFGRSAEELRDVVAAKDPLADAARPQPAIVVCPGRRWCQRALTDTHALADRIRRRLGPGGDPNLTVCISGCPNGCAHSRVADIGLTGAVAGRGEERADAWHLFAGGGLGQDDRLAEPVARGLTADGAVEKVLELAKAFGRRTAPANDESPNDE